MRLKPVFTVSVVVGHTLLCCFLLNCSASLLVLRHFSNILSAYLYAFVISVNMVLNLFMMRFNTEDEHHLWKTIF